MKFNLVYLSVIIVLLLSCQNNNVEIIGTFDSGSFKGWEIQGNSFANGPVSSEEVIGALGKGFASSINEDNEPATGTLTSPEFIITKKSIHFLLGASENYFLNEYSDNKNLAVQLIVKGEIVRSTFPSKFHAMFWEGWDVVEFEGRTAEFRIVDNDNRDGAYINVDQILQTDLPADGLIIERIMEVTNSKLNFPVKEDAKQYHVEIFADGEQIRGIDVALSPDDNIDYWVVNDLSKWEGKEIELRTRQFGEYDPEILHKITFADSIIE